MKNNSLRLFKRMRQMIKDDSVNDSKSSTNKGLLIGIITGIVTSIGSGTINFFYWQKQFEVSENSKLIQLQSALTDSLSEQAFDIVGLLTNRISYRLKVLKLDNPKLDSIPAYSSGEADNFNRKVAELYPEIASDEVLAKKRIRKLFITSLRLLYLTKDTTIKNQLFKTLNILDGETIDSTIASYIIKEFKIHQNNITTLKIDWDKIDPGRISKELSQVQLREAMNLINLLTSRIYKIEIVIENDKKIE